MNSTGAADAPAKASDRELYAWEYLRLQDSVDMPLGINPTRRNGLCQLLQYGPSCGRIFETQLPEGIAPCAQQLHGRQTQDIRSVKLVADHS